MAVFLLDANLLLALVWDNHVHHLPANRWFAGLQEDQWATCPITQCSLVRISSNPKFTAPTPTPQQALGILEKFIAHPRHIFWENSIGLSSKHFPTSAVRGHQQITDAYLFALCLHYGGRLATFDAAIPSLAQNMSERDAVLVLSPA